MTALSPREGYRRWAPTYEGETAITALERGLVDVLTPPLAGMRLLDAGCGTGRRLIGSGAAIAVGTDLSPEMLAAGAAARDPTIRLIEADVRCLPLPDSSFDMLWCRLVIGHLPDCGSAYAELARVADAGATLVVTDFHPAAHAAGHRRSFRDAMGDVHEVEHHVHTLNQHQQAAEAVGLRLTEVREAVIGPEVRAFYAQSGKLALHAEHLGLPVVLALAFRRGG